jgi:hypothetical protein
MGPRGAFANRNQIEVAVSRHGRAARSRKASALSRSHPVRRSFPGTVRGWLTSDQRAGKRLGIRPVRKPANRCRAVWRFRWEERARSFLEGLLSP